MRTATRELPVETMLIATPTPAAAVPVGREETGIEEVIPADLYPRGIDIIIFDSTLFRFQIEFVIYLCFSGRCQSVLYALHSYVFHLICELLGFDIQ